MVPAKVLLVPDGLEGERVDAVMARVLGLSRGRSADLIADGRVRLDGAAVAKSERARAGAMLEVDLDEPAAGRCHVACRRFTQHGPGAHQRVAAEPAREQLDAFQR